MEREAATGSGVPLATFGSKSLYFCGLSCSVANNPNIDNGNRHYPCTSDISHVCKKCIL